MKSVPPGLIEDRDQISGFDVNGSSNGIPRLGGTVDFRTLVAGPAMVVTSVSRKRRELYSPPPRSVLVVPGDSP